MTVMGESLGRRLEMLVECSADRFDPPRFQYIRSLARRGRGLTPSAGRRVEQKAVKALDDYVARYETAYKEAGDAVQRISSKFPDAEDKIRRLFDSGDLMGVKFLVEKLHRNRCQRVLAVLTDQIAQGRIHSDEDEETLSLDELLRRQEYEALKFAQSEGSKSMPVRRHLNSFHLFKETWAKHYANEQVDHALKDCPREPGPLNRQMLATRSLSVMRSLSAGYLSNFVSFVETLLWLQQADR